MRKILIFLALMFLNSGCKAVSQTANLTSTGCPPEPKAKLIKENVKDVSLSDEILKVPSQVSVDKLVGFTFDAKSGQKLSYRTSDDICIWLYSPDNKLLTGRDLPINGKYTLQVSAPKGSTAFNLEMTLGTLQASAPSISPSPHVAISQPSVSPSPSVKISDSNSSNNSSSSLSNTEASDFTQEQALSLVQAWYKAKPQIFAPPFDTSLVDKLTTGKLHDKTTDSDPEKGTIAWLRANNSYYTYNKSIITKVISFSNLGVTPYIKITVYQDLYLHGSKGIDQRNSGQYQGDFIYFFDKENDTWKISEHNKIN